MIICLAVKKLPWYMLGLSNASGMFDISGNMWLVTLTFVYGFKIMDSLVMARI
jgi:hypothetical protein